MEEHEHRFEPCTLVRTSFGALAWVATRSVDPPVSTPGAWKCFICGEQGYAIPLR